jgi:hypothetical protein
MPRRPRVRVVPANEALRKILKHPTGVAFRDEGAVEWPHDRFTRRRIADGSIKLEEKKAAAASHGVAAKPAAKPQPEEHQQPQPEEHRAPAEGHTERHREPHRAPPAHE